MDLALTYRKCILPTLTKVIGKPPLLVLRHPEGLTDEKDFCELAA